MNETETTENVRHDGRQNSELRPIKIARGVNIYAEGSCLIKWGNTHVLCTASVQDKVPPFLRGSGKGWVTAEYSMLPRATSERNARDITKGKPNSRGTEIQRLIGRSLRAAVDAENLGEYTIHIDCDVLQADGGTRTASITGGFVALFDALRWLAANGKIPKIPLKEQVAAVSCGKIGGELMLDLCYVEDSAAEVDSNYVMTGHGDFVEIQGTGEGGIFSREEFNGLCDLAGKGISEIMEIQRAALQLTEEEEKLFPSQLKKEASRKKIVLASKNAHKYEEMKDALSPLGIDLVYGGDFENCPEVEENGATYEENSMIKAKAWAEFTGLPALADDSGIEAEALDNAPGIYSARIVGGSDADRVNWLLESLRGKENRRARFVACLTIVFPDGRQPLVCRGVCDGTIANGPDGENGFGYDPVFIPDGYDKTFAVLGEEVKEKISHRARALVTMSMMIKRFLK